MRATKFIGNSFGGNFLFRYAGACYFIALPVLFCVNRRFRFICTDHLRLFRGSVPESQLILVEPCICQIKNISRKNKG
jgi:hypothetical protein